ncbi:MAG TPA: hypothetical protein VNO75_12140 [Gemmatimonadaceae bacterium]|nr:hypothetical protein [Gemmatimonadaceae bacterium]
MLKQSYLLGSAALLLAVAACDSTGPSTEISQAEAIQLAADMDAVVTLGETDFSLGPSFLITDGSASAAVAAPIAINNSFSVTKRCPQGGHVALAGTTDGTGDRATHSLTLETNATRTDADCAFRTRNGVVTVNGNPNLAYKGNLNIVNGALVGLQTQTHKGSFTWERRGGSGTCEVDLSSSFDPATRTVTVSGHFCGHAIDVTRTRGS